ncbi:hypothetical protein [Winogradskyella bathintestinalis]|uniref:Uncharacterized protein n=1 Tax=Winogradskyella bathintestinalis TaxID=3035208 RepID=A0ABT7ZSW0_9FLAO|nr:hypothetical protein [Winogradskyella bathintestinalis]MDN3492109.1 hypothetical protein [Winogradskyella bathintestinalis]
MYAKTKELLLKYGIPSLAIIVVVVQLFFVNTQKLNKWKGGGYGMYTGIHYFYDQIYIPGLSVDSLMEDNIKMKTILSRLKLMPNDINLEKAAKFVIKTTRKDSIHIQIWKPIVNSKKGTFSRVLVNEVHLKKSQL